jgi:nicotinamidase-related amidase
MKMGSPEAIGRDSFGANGSIRETTETCAAGFVDQIGPALHRSGMNLDIEHAALVVIDPQTEFLTPRSGSTVVPDDAERRTIRNLARLLKASERAGLTVAISLTSPRELASEIMLPIQPYAMDGKTIICSPHIGYRQPGINDVGLRLRRQRVNQVILAGMIVSLPIEFHLRDLIAQGFEIAVVRDAVAGARLPEGIGYLSALVNFRCIVKALWTTDETIQRLG